MQVEAYFTVENFLDEEVTGDSSYDISREELYDAFADFGMTELVEIYYEDGDEGWTARGSGWASFTQSVQFAVNAEMTSRQIQTLIKQVESNINLDDCEVTEIWLIHKASLCWTSDCYSISRMATSASASFGRFKRND